VDDILNNGIDIDDAMHVLMDRPPTIEYVAEEGYGR